MHTQTASFSDGPAFHTRSHTQSTSDSTSAPHTDTAPHISQDTTTTPKPLTADHLDALLQMQRTDPFCKCISKRLLNGKAPHHRFDTFTHVKGLLYKHVTDAGKKFLTLVIPKSWKYMILVETHDKLGHQGNSHTYCHITGKAWIKTSRNTLPTVFCADGTKPRFNSTHYRWQKYLIDHLIK